MKKLNLTHLVLVIFIFTCSTIFSQTDSVLTYYPDDISIEYSNQSMKTVNIDTGRTAMVPILISVMNIKKIKFLNDTLINISGDHQPDLQLNINKIHGIGIGAIFGLVAGLITGIAIGSTGSSGSGGGLHFDGFKTAIGGLSGSGIGIFVGGFIGGIIGNNSPTYKTYDMNKYKFDKKKELERILKIEKRNKLKVES